MVEPTPVVPDAASDKYRRGVLGVACGSQRYPGAAVLAVTAAVRTGCGMVRYLGPGVAEQLVLQRRPEVVLGPGRVQAWLIGSGVALDDAPADADGRWADALRSGLPIVLDAGALGSVSAVRRPELAVLTPHAGELATLLEVERSAVEADPTEAAREAASILGATILLKGSTSVVAAAPGMRSSVGSAIRVGPATPWLATAGTGDVLAGCLGALLATRSAEILDSPDLLPRLALLAVRLHDAAARVASAQLAKGWGEQAPIAALDVAEALAAAVAQEVAQAVRSDPPHPPAPAAPPERP